MPDLEGCSWCEELNHHQVDVSSHLQVAAKVCKFYDMIRQGKSAELSVILDTLRQRSAPVSSSRRDPADDDDDDDDDDMVGVPK